MFTIIDSNEKPALVPMLRLVPRLLSSVGDDKTSYKGNQSGQVISFGGTQN